MTQICALAHQHIRARCRAEPGETKQTLDRLESLTPTRSISLDIPDIKRVVHFDKVENDDPNDRSSELQIRARILMEGIIIEERRILIAKDILPESRWLAYIRAAEQGGMISDFVDFGEAYHTPITSWMVTKALEPHLVLRFDHRPTSWEHFCDITAAGRRQ